MRTYVVIGEYGIWDEVTTEILYVGQNEYVAFNTDVSECSDAEVQVWNYYYLIETYDYNYGLGKWKLRLQ